jgi:YVTN family beta-propeller protein
MDLARPLLLVALAALGGCRITLDDPGSDPPGAQLYYPTGVTVDLTEPLLFVSNGNSDLRYGGGTLQIVDLQLLHETLDRVRATGVGDDECRIDPLDPGLVNCAPARFILGASTIKLGNFAGDIILRDLGNDRRRLFVNVRGDPSITWIDADVNAARRRSAEARLLDCFDAPAPPRGYDAANNSPPPDGCAASHVLQNYLCVGQPDCDTPDERRSGQNIPTEPFGMALDEGLRPDGKPYARLLVSHLSQGRVMLVDVLAAPFAQHVSTQFFQADQQNRRGAFALAPRRSGDPDTLWYLTSSVQPLIATFRVAELGVVVPAGNFALGGAFPVGNDVRDIAFEPGGARAFFAQNNPPSLAVLDTRLRAEPPQAGLPRNDVVDRVDVCQSPSQIRIDERLVPGAGGAPPRRQTRVYVTCFTSNQVMVVDPDLARVTDIVQVGRGPNDVAFYPRSADGSGVLLDPKSGASRRFAYVSHFSEHTLGVIDVTPGSPTENRLVGRLGLPEPPPRP